MQNCLGDLNLTYCLIYLDDVIVFSYMEEEHLECLCIVFDHFREHNLKLKPTKCKFFQSEINYLAHHVFKEGVWAQQGESESWGWVHSTPNIHRNQGFFRLGGTLLTWFIKGFAKIAQPLHQHLSGEGASKKSEWSNTHRRGSECTFMML